MRRPVRSRRNCRDSIDLQELLWPRRTCRTACPASTNPVINFVPLELPQDANLVGRHLLSVNPLVDRVALDAEVLRDLVNRKPAVSRRVTHRKLA